MNDTPGFNSSKYQSTSYHRGGKGASGRVLFHRTGGLPSRGCPGCTGRTKTSAGVKPADVSLLEILLMLTGEDPGQSADRVDPTMACAQVVWALTL
jgi:hypothetical protein